MDQGGAWTHLAEGAEQDGTIPILTGLGAIQSLVSQEIGMRHEPFEGRQARLETGKRSSWVDQSAQRPSGEEKK
jgi:hypothetical protein